MQLFTKHLLTAAKQKSSIILDLIQSLSLIVAAQLLTHWLLISHLHDELVLLPMLSSTGLLDMAFAILGVCSVMSIVRHSKSEQFPNQQLKQEPFNQEQFDRQAPKLQIQTEGN